MGTVLSRQAIQFPDKLGCQDKKKDFTFREWNERSCRLGNGLTCYGMRPRRPFCGNLLSTGWNGWRCTQDARRQARYACRSCSDWLVRRSSISSMIPTAKPLLSRSRFVSLVDGIKDKLPIPAGNFIFLGEPGDPVPEGYMEYEAWLAGCFE